MSTDDYQALTSSYTEVYKAQVQPPVQTVDVGKGQSAQSPHSTSPPTQPTSRWGGRSKPQPAPDPLADMRGKALRLQTPLLKEWRSFAILAVPLFVISAKVIGVNSPLTWITYGAVGGGLSLMLMVIGVQKERAKLGALAWKVAVMFLLMPAAMYAVAYGLTLLFAFSGFKF